MSAVIYASEYIDDILRQVNFTSNDQLVPPTLFQTTKLPPLENHPDSILKLIRKLRPKLKDFSAKQIDEETGNQTFQQSQYLDQVFSVFKSLHQYGENLEWFTDRVDAAVVPNYYSVVPCPMYFGLVAARFYATRAIFPEVPVFPENPDENLFLRFHPDQYGSLFDHAQPIEKRYLPLSQYKKLDVLGERLYEQAAAKPKPYASILEMAKDLAQIGANCMYFNYASSQFQKISDDYFNQLNVYWTRQFPGQPLPEWIFSGRRPENVIPKQVEFMNNAYEQAVPEQPAKSTKKSNKKK